MLERNQGATSPIAFSAKFFAGSVAQWNHWLKTTKSIFQILVRTKLVIFLTAVVLLVWGFTLLFDGEIHFFFGEKRLTIGFSTSALLFAACEEKPVSNLPPEAVSESKFRWDVIYSGDRELSLQDFFPNCSLSQLDEPHFEGKMLVFPVWIFFSAVMILGIISFALKYRKRNRLSSEFR